MTAKRAYGELEGQLLLSTNRKFRGIVGCRKDELRNRSDGDVSHLEDREGAVPGET